MPSTTSHLGGKLEIGPVNFYVDADLPSGFTKGSAEPELDLGGLGNFTLFFEHEKGDLTTAQYGTKAIDRVITGTEMRIEATLRESNLERLDRILQGFSVTPTSGTIDGYVFYMPIGQQDTDIALIGKSVLLEDGAESTDPLDTMYYPLIAPHGTIEWVYNASDQREAKFTFNVYPDPAILFEGRRVLAFSGDILSAGLVTEVV